ncbi:type I polyketide synthase [Chitinophaga nivalis]|uniref:Acyltransferase domain-containing protein n=1 Tax=Chitinophaga nivalis TaxID=2991709 RepID=A0ABT3IJ67_9BACT|nr:beta-ketoacyl synthase N-terminal-like domain-containing protein [Chitinophaga nivalis]MCW3466343.1 acyltransferase domain-containing protein [Chitinophaga nivalis]MCW3483966.1 acyltransferase domain-containing protein [Chitinophaga nivalis]
MKNNQKYTGLEIAIIGVACRLPGAGNWREYWNNLVNGTSSIQVLTDQELLAAGVDEKTIRQPNFVKAKASLKGKELFDAAFFDYLPGEARLMNPVHRIFHECVWEALEDAGYNPEQMNELISLYAGAGDDLNWRISALQQNQQQDIDNFTLDLISSKEHLTTLISYKLNLKGPSLFVNTACSTSLTAVNMACKSLLLGEANMALAGGVTIGTQQRDGYLHQEGMIFSSDGHCRAFDKDASGTVNSEGAGVVLLKRLSDALNDGDQIYAVIKGTALNNDGNRKVGYTAPSVEGQAACIRTAHKFARVEPDSISYIETHGTGTRLGDPIEIEALNIAFNRNKAHRCAIGSVKSNIGHSDNTAGIAGLIKAALSLKYKTIPPSLDYKTPNPGIDFENGPFYVNTSLQSWERSGDAPLRAGVSSFGIGGTNAHAILEEAPEADPGDAGRPYKLLTLSARTEAALGRYADLLKNFLQQEPATDPANLAYTLQAGRKHFTYRKAVLYKDTEELLALLESGKLKEQVTKSKDNANAVVFLFSGQGSQYAGMGKDLYEAEPVFREYLDKGFAIVQTLTGEDFKNIVFNDTTGRINETKFAQPVIFLLEYALAQLLLSWGIVPQQMIGHSIGEYVAACISGIFSFEDALKIVVQRGALMNSLPGGTMLSVPLKEEEARIYLDENIFLAAVNGPEQVVFSGETPAIEALKARLDEADISHITLHTSHAFHSGMQDPILEAFREVLASVTFGKMQLPFISNLTGKEITAAEATTPAYWVRHLRETVRFSDGVKTLLALKEDWTFLEVGAGQSLVALLKQQPARVRPVAFNLLRPAKEKENDLKYLTVRIGQLWQQGLTFDWKGYYRFEKRNRISLPTYAFEKVSYPAEVNPFDNDLVRELYALDPQPQQAAAAQVEEQPVVPVKRAERPDLPTSYIPPATNAEERLKGIFERFFGIDDIGVEDDFFELGGDSLKGMVLLKRIKNEFNVELSLKDFFGMQTIRQIGANIDELNLLPVSEQVITRKTITI